MAREGRLNSKQLKDLSDELAALAKEQSDARLTEVYVRMTHKRLKRSTSERNVSPGFPLFSASTTPIDNFAGKVSVRAKLAGIFLVLATLFDGNGFARQSQQNLQVHPST